MQDTGPSTKFDLEYADYKIIFCIASCSRKKEYSFYNKKLDRTNTKILLDRLRHIEGMDWKDFMSLERAKGATSEKSNTESFKMIYAQDRHTGKLAEQYYFHFRTKGGDKFRVFGYQHKQHFYITHIDTEGKIHNHK